MEQTANTVMLQPEGYALVTVVGKQDYMTMDRLAKKCTSLAAALRAEGKPLLGLVDATEDNGFSSGTNKAVMKALEEIPYDRVAMFGLNTVLTEVTNSVIAALGKGDRTKLFKTREEALAWLMMKDPVYGYDD